MAITFPNSPILNDETTIGSRTFIFNGIGWVVKQTTIGDLVQETGTSESDVMSQNAVTEALNAHINDSEDAHMASAIGLSSGKSLQEAIDDGDIGGGSGHTIQSSSLTYPQRDNLKFTGNVTVSDNAFDTTIVNIKQSPWTTIYIDSAVTTTFTAVPWVTYLIIATTNPVTVKLPNSVSGNTDEFRVVLYQNTHKVTVTTVGGSQSIGGYSSQVIPTVGATLHLKANGTSGYDVVNDTRSMKRIEVITSDRDFSDGDGFENEVLYICQPSGNEIFLTLLAPILLAESKSISARFLLDGDGIVTISVEDSSLIGNSEYQILTKAGSSITITLANGGYFISDDSRDTIIPNLITYLLSENSSISDTLTGLYFKQRSTTIDDSRYESSSTLVTTSVPSTYPSMTLLQSSITDQNILRGFVPGNSVQSCIWGYVTGGPCYFRVEYYLRTEGGVETLIGKSHTSLFSNTSVEEICMYAQFDNFTISETDRIVIRPYVAKKNSGDTVSINFYVEGSQGTRTGFTIPSSNITHNNIEGRNSLGAHVMSAISADSGNNGKFLQVNSETDTFDYVTLDVDVSTGITDSTAWDGTSYTVDLSSNKIYKRAVSNGVTTLTFSLGFAPDSVTKSRKVKVIINNSGNSSAISSITFTGGNWNWDLGIEPSGLAIGAIANLEIENEDATNVKPSWTVNA